MSEHPSNKEWFFDYQLLSKLVIGIGEVAEITGLPTRKIRYWEDKGIIQSKNDGEGTTRKYSYLDIKKIILIQELLTDGYTLDAAAKKVEDRIKNVNQTMMNLSKHLNQQD